MRTTLALLLACLLAGCGQPEVTAREHLVFHTNAGDLLFKLYPRQAPRAMDEMLTMTRAGVFDGTHFGWVEAGHDLKLGFDLRGQPMTPRQRSLIHKLPDELTSLAHRRGMLYLPWGAFDVGASHAQICIWLGNNLEAKTRRTIVGELESGFDVLDEIERVPPTADGHTPSLRIEVVRAEVVDDVGALKLVKAISLAPDCHVGGGHPTAHKFENGGAALVSERLEADGSRTKNVSFKNMFIDRIYPSMRGPWKLHHVLLQPAADPHVWITRYKAQVVDSASGAPCQEYMCHTNVSLSGVPGTEGTKKAPRAQMSISQGQMEVVFPQGFALCINNHADRQLQVNAMVLNNNQKEIQKLVDFNTTLSYYDEAEASRRHLTPLYQTSVFCAPLTDPKTASPGETVCKPADPPDISDWLDNRPRSGHWMVPPGRQVLTQDVTKILGLYEDTTAHYIWMHVHPYAESLELRDDTSGQTTWKGLVHTPDDPRQALVLSTDSYSSATGLPLHYGHRYQLITTYNNRTDHEVDAMAALWIYVRDNVRHD